MRAAVLHKPMQLSIENVPEPKCGSNELLIKVHRSAICNTTDTHIWQGNFRPRATPPLPHILGHECCGEVIEVGEKCAKAYNVGDRVGFWVKMTGGFAEYNAIKPNALGVCKLKNGMSYDEGALLELACGTIRLIYDSGLRIGDKVLIFGQGPAGLFLAQEARLAGAAEIYAVDLYDNRLAKSRELASDYTLNLSCKNYEEALDILQQRVGQIDIVIDAMGDNRWAKGNSVEMGLNLLKRHGRYIIFGHRRLNDFVNTYLVSNEDITMRGFEPGIDRTKNLANFVVELVASGRLKAGELITHHFPLEDIEKGLNKCLNDLHETLKVIIDIA
ncbi:MAG: alcohol dehydrogenase catalytic domain-containing protein [Candidatus Neomarinimicrobiota bacterium]